MSDQPELVPVLVAAARFGGMTKPKLYKLIREEAFPFDGTLPVIQIGDRKFVRSTQLERFLSGDEPAEAAG